MMKLLVIFDYEHDDEVVFDDVSDVIVACCCY